MLKSKHRFCLNCLAECLRGKNEEESQCTGSKINILKVDISPSSDLKIVLSLLQIKFYTCSKNFKLSLINFDHYAKHIQYCLLDISPSSSLLVTNIFDISDNANPRLAEDAKLHFLKSKLNR